MKRLARSMAGVAGTGLALGHQPGDHDGARIEAEKVPAALRAFWADGFFASAQDAFILAYLPLLASALGANAIQIGLLSASQSLGAMLALYPGALAARRAASRRWMVVFYAGVLGRLLLLGSAIVVAVADGQTALYTITAMFAVRSFLGNFTLPAWTSLAADIIPDGIRARYFASRNFAIQGALLAFTPLGGLVLDWWGFPGGYVLALSVSFALGMVATVAYALIPEPPRREVVKAAPIRATEVFRRSRFRMFLLATFALHFATMIAGPFFNVYLKENLGASNFEVGWLTTSSAVAALLGQLVFGEMMARRGSLWLTRMSLVVLPLLPILWAFITEPWMVLAPNILGGLMWAAFNLANFQGLLEVTPEEDREQYVALFHMSLFLALFISPFIGGAIIELVGYRTAFVVSGTGRLVATALFFLAIVPTVRGGMRADE
ncbi:MAG TPA: MFS transporter [Tepidiformaceae bacterium]|nr:MFS transporter [Tepidiformaceae bacterium]